MTRAAPYALLAVRRRGFALTRGSSFAIRAQHGRGRLDGAELVRAERGEQFDRVEVGRVHRGQAGEMLRLRPARPRARTARRSAIARRAVAAGVWGSASWRPPERLSAGRTNHHG